MTRGSRRRWTVVAVVLVGSAWFAFAAQAKVDGNLNAPRGTVSVISTTTDEAVARPIKVGPNPSSIAISPNGQRAYVVTSGNGRVAVIDLATDRLLGAPTKIDLFRKESRSLRTAAGSTPSTTATTRFP